VLDEARKRLGRDWPRYLVVEVTQALAEIAGDYADAFALRAYDAVQLASARTVQQATDDEVGFACFDHRLRTAAAVLGMRSIPA
jgi:predicted nucleic acid-binding protein